MRNKLLSIVPVTGLLAAASFAVPALADAPLADAAEAADARAVRTLLRRGADIDAAQVDGMTALHWAVRHDDLELADRLLAAGADVAATTGTGVRPMQFATENGSAAMIERLLEAGEDPNVVLTPTFETALMLAAHTGNDRAVAVLLERGADPNARQVRDYTPLMFAASEGHADVVSVLLEHGADPALTTVAAERRERRPAGGMTPLIFSARQGHLDTAEALIAAGADVDQRSADGTTALLIAVVNGHYELAESLLAHGADPSLANDGGRSPLYSAIDLRNIQWSQAPAPHLPQEAHMAMIRALVEAGADVDQALSAQVPHRGSFDMRWTELKGGTPFLRAAWNGDIEVMRFLLEHGADPYAVTEQGETALLLLTGAGWPLGQGYIRPDAEIMAALELLADDLGMDVNAATAEGITGLMSAVFKGTTDVIEFLVERGADLTAVDNDGRTILTWARGVAANMGQPPRPQPDAEAMVRRLAEQQGVELPAEGTPMAHNDAR